MSHHFPFDMTAWERQCAVQQALTRTTRKSAMQRGFDEIDAKARRLCAQLVKNAARRYLRQPWQLNMIMDGLSMAHPRVILAVVAHEQEKVDRWVGFSGSVRPVNLRGATIYARYLRRFGDWNDQYLEAAE